MRTLRKIVLPALVLGCVCLGATRGHAGVSIGIGVGFPGYYRPYCGYGWYRPYGFGVYVAPPPVVVAPAPVYQVAPVVQPVYAAPPPPTTAAAPPPTAVAAAAPEPELTPPPRLAGNAGAYLRDLSNPDERVRAEASLQLGRMKAQQAVEPLTQVLGQDRSPAVRDAAARALGLLGAPAALTALQHAAQADDDRDVRRSASFAADVIRGNLRGR
jgi:HEAT repeats